MTSLILSGLILIWMIRGVKDVRDELKEGQQILVKCIGKEGTKIKLSRKAVLRDEGRKAEAASASDSD